MQEQKVNFCSAKLGADIFSWSFDMEGHVKKCVERCCELVNKKHQLMYKVTTPCLDDYSTNTNWELLENCEKYTQIVVTCLYLARIGRPDILWSVNKLARAVTKWTRGCDKRLARLFCYIHHTF